MVEVNETQRTSIPLSNPEVLYDKGGRICWRLPGNTEEENEQLAIKNVQGLFLQKFPEFNELFPRIEGVIEEGKREEAEKFVMDKIGTHRKISSVLSSAAYHAFENSSRLLLKKSFGLWEIQFNILDNPPEDWINNRSLSIQLGRLDSVVKHTADKLKAKYPDWYREYSDKIGSTRIHYSPQLADEVKKELLRYSNPSEGWMVNFPLSRELGVKAVKTKNIADKFRESNPDWFREFKSKSRVMEYYSPELVAKIRQELSKYDSPPEGWFTNHYLADQSATYTELVKEIADRFREKHPEWFVKYKASNGQISEFYSPELQIKLSEALPKVGKPQRPPEDWFTNNALSKELEFSQQKIKSVAYEFKESHPEWFREYSVNGNRVVHYSPELVAKIRQELLKYDSPPEGWFTKYFLSRLLEKSSENIYSIAEKFKEEHPDWYAKFRGNNDKILEYYSPELVEEITRIIKERKEKKEKDNITPEEAERMFKELMGK